MKNCNSELRSLGKYSDQRELCSTIARSLVVLLCGFLFVSDAYLWIEIKCGKTMCTVCHCIVILPNGVSLTGNGGGWGILDAVSFSEVTS